MPDEQPGAESVPGFAELGLPVVVVHALRRQGATRPRDIQVRAVPPVLAGRDVLGRAPTGSGKTLAFGVPMLVRLTGSASRPSRPRALVLAPTRELADQIVAALDEPALALGMRTTALTGGSPIGRQVQTLARGTDLVVATPGRLLDHLRRGSVHLDDVVVTTVDEADHLAELGFLPQITEILDTTPSAGQRLLFSATLDGDVGSLVSRYLRDPVRVHTTVDAPPARMTHHVLVVDKADKPDVVDRLARGTGRILLFVRTQAWADRLVARLVASGVDADVLHGGKSQAYRSRALARFTDGTTPVLVATDVAARGIHVDDVALVVHADPPSDAKSYVHRAGRTARAGASGTVVTVVTEQERDATLVLLEQAQISPAVHRTRRADPVLERLAGSRAAPAPPGPRAATAPQAPPTPPRGRRRRGATDSRDGANPRSRSRHGRRGHRSD
ncbi:DEAD/DEAH box helicase [Rhodococcus triatomae]|uniref:Superfamily II DNA and RNA helicase n=1 Tax=Rhodococcus triatomae TaxID=300028 RepID=A0A1G8K6D2_9NOCA|nr:DEAD/DEAH box helicase [Rhodococcus triatomae]QNG18836.1 DEAD/DEAH box helicase [Rhodococcus triatomae]QNG25253.1 DEAD/DEAH box helicase [Rhodococcus triatomae]SDI38953.1 Superfamily II DNA and RNA helicase [Rhodococcus triatomae]